MNSFLQLQDTEFQDAINAIDSKTSAVIEEIRSAWFTIDIVA